MFCENKFLPKCPNGMPKALKKAVFGQKMAFPHIKTIVKAKLLILDTSKMAKNDPQGLLFMIKGVPQNFSIKNLGSAKNWYVKMVRSKIHTLVNPKLLFLATSNTA